MPDDWKDDVGRYAYKAWNWGKGQLSSLFGGVTDGFNKEAKANQQQTNSHVQTQNQNQNQTETQTQNQNKPKADDKGGGLGLWTNVGGGAALTGLLKFVCGMDTTTSVAVSGIIMALLNTFAPSLASIFNGKAADTPDPKQKLSDDPKKTGLSGEMYQASTEQRSNGVPIEYKPVVYSIEDGIEDLKAGKTPGQDLVLEGDG